MHKTPRPVYKLEDLPRRQIDGQFYAEEVSPARITKRTMYNVDKILKMRVRSVILGYLVCWRVYTAYFDSCIAASYVKHGQ